MEENKNVQTASQPAKDKKDKKEKRKSSFFAEHKAEFKRITWPSRKDLVKETTTVIVVSLIVGVIIFGMDTLLSLGYDKLISLDGGNSGADTSIVTDTQLPVDTEIITEALDVEIADAEAEVAETEVVETEEAEATEVVE